MKPRQIDRRELVRATRLLCAQDPRLAAMVEQFGPAPLWARKTGFATLVLIIMEQQVTLASGRAAFERLEAVAGGMTPERIAKLSEASLQRAGITRQKGRYCRELATRLGDGRFSFRRVARAGDAEARSLLCELTGIGPWTADVYLLFALRRPDIWPVGDLALEKAMQEVEGLRERPRPQHALEIAERWRPWRSVAARLLWHSYLSRRGRRAG